MAVPVKNVSAPGFTDEFQVRTDTRAMSVATALFFMVGFLTCLNDIIIPHLKSIFELNYAEVLTVQFAFFTSYFVFSYPGGKLVDNYGYKKTMVFGLLVMALGAAGFIPAAHFALFPVFLCALIVLAAGMTVVQVAVNPYVTVIGPPATASSRLNLAQAFNSVGTFIAPFFGSQLILATAPATVTPERLHSMTDVARQALSRFAGIHRSPALHRHRAHACSSCPRARRHQAQDHHRRLRSTPRTSAPAPSLKPSRVPTASGVTPGSSALLSASSPTSAPRSPSAASSSTT